MKSVNESLVLLTLNAHLPAGRPGPANLPQHYRFGISFFQLDALPDEILPIIKAWDRHLGMRWLVNPPVAGKPRGVQCLAQEHFSMWTRDEWMKLPTLLSLDNPPPQPQFPLSVEIN